MDPNVACFSLILVNTPQKPTNSVNASPKQNRICRNISIYGYCKFQGRGCEFSHEKSPSKSTRKLNFSSEAKDLVEREKLHKLLEAMYLQCTPQQSSDLPSKIHGYCNMEHVATDNPFKTMLGHRTRVYKAKSSVDGSVVLLKRIANYKLENSGKFFESVDKFKRLSHPCLVQLKETFTTKNFADDSLIFSYEFAPCSQTLDELISLKCIEENQIWSLLSQMLIACSYLKEKNISLGLLNASRILVSDRDRFRINYIGIHEIIGQTQDSHPIEDLFEICMRIKDSIPEVFSDQLTVFVKEMQDSKGKTIEFYLSLLSSNIATQLSKSFLYLNCNW